MIVLDQKWITEKDKILVHEQKNNIFIYIYICLLHVYRSFFLFLYKFTTKMHAHFVVEKKRINYFFSKMKHEYACVYSSVVYLVIIYIHLLIHSICSTIDFFRTIQMISTHTNPMCCFRYGWSYTWC